MKCNDQSISSHEGKNHYLGPKSRVFWTVKNMRPNRFSAVGASCDKKGGQKRGVQMFVLFKIVLDKMFWVENFSSGFLFQIFPGSFLSLEVHPSDSIYSESCRGGQDGLGLNRDVQFPSL